MFFGEISCITTPYLKIIPVAISWSQSLLIFRNYCLTVADLAMGSIFFRDISLLQIFGDSTGSRHRSKVLFTSAKFMLLLLINSWKIKKSYPRYCKNNSWVKVIADLKKNQKRFFITAKLCANVLLIWPN